MNQFTQVNGTKTTTPWGFNPRQVNYDNQSTVNSSNLSKFRGNPTPNPIRQILSSPQTKSRTAQNIKNKYASYQDNYNRQAQENYNRSPEGRLRGGFNSPRSLPSAQASKVSPMPTVPVIRGSAAGGVVSIIGSQIAAPIAEYLGQKSGEWLGDRLREVMGKRPLTDSEKQFLRDRRAEGQLDIKLPSGLDPRNRADKTIETDAPIDPNAPDTGGRSLYELRYPSPWGFATAMAFSYQILEPSEDSAGYVRIAAALAEPIWVNGRDKFIPKLSPNGDAVTMLWAIPWSMWLFTARPIYLAPEPQTQTELSPPILPETWRPPQFLPVPELELEPKVPQKRTIEQVSEEAQKRLEEQLRSSSEGNIELKKQLEQLNRQLGGSQRQSTTEISTSTRTGTSTSGGGGSQITLRIPIRQDDTIDRSGVPTKQLQEQLDRTFNRPPRVPNNPIDFCLDPCIADIQRKLEKLGSDDDDDDDDKTSECPAPPRSRIKIKIFRACKANPPNDDDIADYDEISIDVPASEAENIKELHDRIFELQKEDCKKPDPPCIAAVPEWWQVRLGADRPQLVVQYAEKISQPGQPPKYGAPMYALTIPHYSKSAEQTIRELFPVYQKGQAMSVLTLADNSKLIVNCVSQRTAQLVTDKLSESINADFLEDSHLSLGTRKGQRLKTIVIYPRIAKYFADGQKDTKPTWIKYFKEPDDRQPIDDPGCAT